MKTLQFEACNYAGYSSTSLLRGKQSFLRS